MMREPVETPPDTGTDTDAIPAGYTVLERGGVYFQALGPLYQRVAEDGTLVIAVRVADKHANLLGVAHGGMLMTLADSAMGINVGLARPGSQAAQSSVTTMLSNEFLSPARIGDWLEARTRIRRNGQRVVFVDCTLTVGEREVMHSSGTFLPI